MSGLPTIQGIVMRQIFFLAAALLAVGAIAARFADTAVEGHSEPQAAAVQPSYEPREPTSSGRSLMLESDRQGHYQVEAES